MRSGCKVRDREPSRVGLKRVLKSLKMRKSRPKCKRFIRKSVPVSSVLFCIASNYKEWNIIFAKKQDSFFSNYFGRALIHKTCIDHIYTNMDEDKIQANVWETYFSDHKAIYALINGF